jgi:hypothetical protein
MAEDDERAREWAAAAAAENEKTVADGVPIPVVDPKTPPVEVTGRHRLTPAQFANAVELTDRDGYARGFAAGRSEAQADNVTELRKVREDCIDTMRSLWVIFEIAHPSWEAAEEWIRRRITPL